ncbi:hypothetical protein [Methylorubrum extorquens]|uniref:hypothetical protein n=1 Tax=Methylorubrum extorquens TaxID=408 RepID=UPI00209DA50A|nr:hypothetical protein [Methylorubrum extorquens]MCP1540033.1 hypothetical protein [Methylorubrum extorquens]
MKTGRYRFEIRYTQRRWFTPPRPVMALMVEHEVPIDQNQLGLAWREANSVDLNEYQELQCRRQIELDLAKDRIKTLETRLESVLDIASLV